MPYAREEKASHGFGSAVGGAAPCANCEDNPQRVNDLFCSDDCRDEYNGEGKYAE